MTTTPVARFAPVVWMTAEANAAYRTVSVRVTGAGAFLHVDEAEGIPIRHWADWLDGWAVDFDANRPREERDGIEDSPFVSDWQTFRTRRHRRLELISAPHVYDQPGAYRIVVRGQSLFAYPCGCDLQVVIP